jgi:hypothetical protein
MAASAALRTSCPKTPPAEYLKTSLAHQVASAGQTPAATHLGSPEAQALEGACVHLNVAQPCTRHGVITQYG